MQQAGGRRGRVGRRVVVLAGLTVGAFIVAVAARGAVVVVADTLHRSTPATVADGTFAVLDALAGIGAAAAGLGVLCFGATLVAAVLGGVGGRVPTCIGIAAAVLAVVAFGVGLLAARMPGYPEAAGLSVLRTALAGLAAASLPAVVLGAVRTRAARRTTWPDPPPTGPHRVRTASRPTSCRS